MQEFRLEMEINMLNAFEKKIVRSQFYFLKSLLIMILLFIGGCASSKMNYNCGLFGREEQARKHKFWINLVVFKYETEQSKAYTNIRDEKEFSQTTIDILPERIIREMVMSLTSWTHDFLLYQDEFDSLFSDHYSFPTFYNLKLAEKSHGIGEIDKNTTFSFLNEKSRSSINISFVNMGYSFNKIIKSIKLNEKQISQTRINWVKIWPIGAHFYKPITNDQILYITPFNNIHWGSSGTHFTLMGMISYQKNYRKFLPFYFHIDSEAERFTSTVIPLLSLYKKNDYFREKNIIGISIK